MFRVICLCHCADRAPAFSSYVGLVLTRKRYRVGQIWHWSNHLMIGYPYIERSALTRALIWYIECLYTITIALNPGFEKKMAIICRTEGVANRKGLSEASREAKLNNKFSRWRLVKNPNTWYFFLISTGSSLPLQSSLFQIIFLPSGIFDECVWIRYRRSNSTNRYFLFVTSLFSYFSTILDLRRI